MAQSYFEIFDYYYRFSTKRFTVPITGCCSAAESRRQSFTLNYSFDCESRASIFLSALFRSVGAVVEDAELGAEGRWFDSEAGQTRYSRQRLATARTSLWSCAVHALS